MMTTAWCERDGARVEVAVSDALASPDQAYRCPRCDGLVFPRSEEGAPAEFRHVAGSESCRRNPLRPDRRKTFRVGGRRADD